MAISKSAVYAWLNLAPKIPKVEFYSEPHSNDAEVHGVNGCKNNDCKNYGNVLGQARYNCNSDNCDIDIFAACCNWSTNGDTYADIQAVLTHEFGHCLGLDDNPNNGESVMQYSESWYMRQRFPRADDKNGVWYTQDSDHNPDTWPVYWRISSAYSWSSSIGSTTGSPSIGTAYVNGYLWDVMAFLGPGSSSNASHIRYKARRSDGVWQRYGGFCEFPLSGGGYEYSYDGVSVSRDISGFAIAFRSHDDNAQIRIIRNLIPTTQGDQCGTYSTQVLTDVSTWRSPDLAYDYGTSRLVLAYIRKEDVPHIAIRTTNTISGSWTSPIVLDEWTDGPVGIDCDYWSPTSSYKCWIAFPESHGSHHIRLCRGYINQYGNFVKETCHTNENYQSGNTHIGVTAYSNSVALLYTGMDNPRHVNKLVIDSNWNWSNEVYDARSPTGPDMSNYGRQIHAGFNE